MSDATSTRSPTTGASVVLLSLCAGQFLMALDSSVMNVSIATVAKDLDTTITGIQSAIVLYTLVMAMLMVTGGKIGSIVGRKRAFMIGLVIYCSGSLTTALAPSLPVLLLGWSLLEGIGAALIMPAIVALVAGNFPPSGRPRAYGLVGAAGAIAIAVGPLIGGLATTYASWRWVFAGEVLVGAGIFLFGRRIADAPVTVRSHLDLLGSILWALGMGLAIVGVLFSSDWGWILPADGAPSWLGMSPTFWLLFGGLVAIRLFMTHIRRVSTAGGEPLVTPSLFRNRQMTGGLLMFFFQFVVMMGLFFVIPLYLSVALGLSAIDTGLKITPLSLAMLLAAAGIPRFFPAASPRRIVALGLIAVLIGIVALFSTMDVHATASIVTVPLILIGLGMGGLASQLGSVTVSAVPDDESPEVGGLQNTASQFGASLGTALAGSVLIASLTASFLSGITHNPDVPDQVEQQASIQLSSGGEFISDAQLEAALQEAGVPQGTSQAILDANQQARIDGLRSALALLAFFAMVALFFSRRIPEVQPGSTTAAPSEDAAEPR
ncbi:MAG TPA: MFS transporter [Actinomycetota bacterium]|nr:MFS transporter [Actinomycetota bacterium]